VFERSRIAFYVCGFVSGENFYGRRKETKNIVDNLLAGESILVTGERKIGKSSILHHVASQKEFKELSDSQIHYIHGGSCYHAEDIIVSLVRSLSPSPKKDDDQWSLAKHILDNQPNPVILFIDDLDDMFYGGEEPDKLATFFRSMIDSGHVIACATSWRNYLQLDQQRELFRHFNLFQNFPLGAFTLKEALSFLVEASAKSGDAFTQQEAELLISLFGRIPYRLQIVGRAVFCQEGFVGSRGRKRLEKMSAAFLRLINNEHYESTLEGLTETQFDILLRTAHGEPLVSENANVSYLINRAFLSEGDTPFSPMGSVFKDFLCGLPEKEGNRTTLDTIRSVALGAIKTAINTAIKSLMT